MSDARSLTPDSSPYDPSRHPYPPYPTDLPSNVFGQPFEAEDRTLIRVKRTRHVGMAWSSRDGSTVGFATFGDPLSSTKSVAHIEVDNGEVRIKRKSRSLLPFIITGAIISVWNAYWLLRTFREWRAGR